MWEQIRSNQMRSAFLIGILGALLVLVGYFLGVAFMDNGIAGLFIAVIIWVIMLLIAYFQGDSILLSVAGARKITADDHPQLYNIVEEMKIASGLEKMPDIYIVDDPAMNAFATGRSKDKTAVTVTSGLLQNLNRDELQGVIGHEISHIKNRDVLLMSLAGVLLGTIVILAWYGTRIMFFGGMAGRRSSSRSSGGGQAQIIILALALVLMILAPIAAQLLYFAISRKREYLADASSALYTRYPEGLASALEKLAASTKQLKNANNATAPMYTINPFRKEGHAATDLTSTHPPISERIRILRTMAGASPADYERAYEQVKHQKIIPQSVMAAASSMALRTPSAETRGVEADRIARSRETSDMLLRMNKYKIVTCPACGTKYKIPPDFPEPGIVCARCGSPVDIR
jgi:heat shock protein HtpX